MGGKSSTSTQQVQIPPSVLAQYNAVNARATDTASTPFQQYGGQFVAPVNQQQSAGIAGTNAAANEAQPYFGAATGTLGQAQAGVNPINQYATGLAAGSAGAVNPGALDVDRYISPYLKDVVGSESALLNQNNQQQQAGQLGTAIQSGAFGGDRTGIAAANLEQQQNLANANIYSNLLNQGYNTALGTAQQQQGVNLEAGQANRAALGSAATNLAGIGQTAYGEGANTATELAGLGAGAQTAGLQGAQAQIGAGTLQQQTQQAQDSALYNQFLQQQSYPFQVDQFLANIAEGTGALSGSTTTTTQPGGVFSDTRLKHDIKKIGELYDGQHIVSYKMHGDPRTRIGLIAQDVKKKHPDAVGLAKGYQIVDYGKATEEAANRGHFYAGGVVPIRQAHASGGGAVWEPGAFADGGTPYGASDGPYDLGSILASQQAMYAPMQHRRDIPNQGGVGGHQLTVASGSPTPPPSGASNVNQTIGLGEKGYKLYSHFNSPTYSGPTPGVAPAAAESSAGSGDLTASLGAADTGAAAGAAAPVAAEAAAPAAEAAAGSAAGAAGTAAAGAAGAGSVGAGTETAAALAAEYAAAYAAAAAAAAKRGGRIRGKLAAGGTPYEGLAAGSPYTDSGGEIDIPDTENTAHLQSPGALKKQPTGLQTAMTLGSEQGASNALGSIFSNQALARGGIAGRHGYDDGGDVPDMLPEQTVEAARPSPIEYTGGVSNTDAAPMKTEAPRGVAAGESDAPKDHWWKHAENVVPLLSGLAAMGTAPTRSWGTALAAGLGAGAESYLPAHQQQADIQARQIQNQIAQTKLNAYRQPPAQIPGAQPSDAPDPSAPLPDRLRKQYAVNTARTPQEFTDFNQAQNQSMLVGKAPIEKANAAYQNRIKTQQFQNQQDAQKNYDAAYHTATHSQDPALRASAASAADAYRQWTGDQFETQDGVLLNKRTTQPPIGAEAQRISPQTYTELMARAVAKNPVPTGVPGETVLMPNWQIAGAKSAQEYVASLPPPGTPGAGTDATPSAPTQAAPTRQAAPAVAPRVAPQKIVPTAPARAATAPTSPTTANAFADPEYKLPAIKRQIGLTPGKDVEKQVEATSEKRKLLQEDAEQTAQSSAASLQFGLAAKQIMDSKGKPVTGLFGPAAKTISSVFGGVNATNYQEVAKYLGNLAVQTGKGNFPNATQKEVGLQFEQLSPSTAQTESALRDLLDANIRTSQYTLDTANRAGKYLDRAGYNGDPQQFFRWNQAHFPREDLSKQAPSTAGTQEGAVGTSKSGKPIVFANGHWQYKP